MRTPALAVLALAACAPHAPSASPHAEAEAKGRIMADVRFLASDALRGRATPGPGLEAAAHHIAHSFERTGLLALPGAAGNGYVHRFAYPLHLRLRRATLEASTETNSTRTFREGIDFTAPPGASRSVMGALYDAGRHDARRAAGNRRARGRVILIDGPAPAPGRLRVWGEILRRDVEEAQALAILMVVGDAHTIRTLDEEARAENEIDAFDGPARIPLLYVSHEVAHAMRSLPTEPLVRLSTLSEQSSHPSAPNVVALLPGADPVLRHEVVVISAHFDHLGVGRLDAHGDSIYNGADDNASGTAALMEAARILTKGPRPARSILFLAVSAEEAGLAGSRAFLESEAAGRLSLIANINLDMVGRASALSLIGGGISTLGAEAHEVAAAHAIPLTDGALSHFARSDHFRFAEAGVPAIGLSTGLHADYHAPSDESERVDPLATLRAARLAGALASRLAQSSSTPPQWKGDAKQHLRGMIAGHSEAASSYALRDTAVYRATLRPSPRP